MNRSLYLQWFHENKWHVIGWRADTPTSQMRLRRHGKALSADGGQYRLVSPSHLADAPVEVLHTYPVVEVAS